MIKIYIDIYFFINFAVDFLSLYWASRFVLFSAPPLKITLSAGVGGVWSLIYLFFPSLAFLNLFIPYIMAVIVSGRKKNIRVMLSFLLFEMLFGGIISALNSLFAFLFKNNLALFFLIVAGVFISFLFYDISEIYIKKKMKTVSVSATLTHKGKEKKVCLLIDSGNLAREMITKRRVIFIKERVISDIYDELTYAIPIKTATGSSVKYAFIPDKINFNDKSYNTEQFIIVPDTEGCEFGGYDGIIGVI